MATRMGVWERIPELTDEFDGERLDPDKWWDHNPHWIGRPPALFLPSNVEVRGGALRLTARAENPVSPPNEQYHTFTTAAVKSKALVRYGYFEIRSRAMRSRASSAFWFYDEADGSWTEIDVFEMAGGDPSRRCAVLLNAHVFYTPDYHGEHLQYGSRWEAPFGVADEDHVYALWWGPKELRWYVDRACVKTLENTHWHQPLRLNFDSETFPDWFGLPEPSELPATFSVDYVRSWRYTGTMGPESPLPPGLAG